MGVVLVLKTPDSPFPLPQDLPDLLALGSGMTFALTNIWLLRLQHTPASARMIAMFGGGAFMAMVCAVLASITGVIATPALELPHMHALAWAPWVIGLSVAFLISNFTLQYGAARLRAHTTSMVMMSEIVFASVSSVALGASTLTWRISLGGGMIVLAALLASQAHTPKDNAP
jgi:drug/metabolite transporter (DMT)-like permease